MAVRKNLQDIVRGDDVLMTITIATEAGGVINVTGDTIYFTVKKKAVEPDVAAHIAKIIEVPNDANSILGIVELQLQSIETGLKADTYSYDIQWKRNVSGNFEIITLQYGTVLFVQDVTFSTSNATV